MTAYAVLSSETPDGTLTVELRSVNHRYLDVQLRLPEELRTLETPLREKLAALLNRGKVECRISHTPHQAAAAAGEPDPACLQRLAAWSRTIRAALPEARELSVAEVLAWPGLLPQAHVLNERLQSQTLALLEQVLLEFNAARAREGARLKDFLLQRMAQIEAQRNTVLQHLPVAIRNYQEKLRTRLQEALGSADSERLHQELALYASKIDVDEELSRLHSHLAEMHRILEQGGPVGKRLDFLMQEMNREANTLGAKAADLEISRAALELKVLIEQMREQIQNLE